MQHSNSSDMHATPQSLRLFTHPQIYTMEPDCPVANWILTLGDTIVAIGSDMAKLPLWAAQAEVIELPGECVIPGFIDAHAHLARYLLVKGRPGNTPADSTDSANDWLDLSGCGTAELLQRVAAAAQARPAGTWIVGGGWDQASLVPFPIFQQLNEAAPHHPLLLSDNTLHAALANAQALAIANIHEDSWNPRGGHIGKDWATGRLTGLLHEHAVPLVERHIPGLGRQATQTRLASVMAELNSLGIVGVHDLECSAGYDMFPTLARQLAQAPERFTVRCLSTLKADTWQAALANGLWPGFGNDYLRIGCLKLIHDGSLGTGTALMSEPYAAPVGEDTKVNFGTEVVSRGELQYLAREACERKVPLAIHAIGDRATQNVAELFEELGYRPGYRPLRHRIEHVQSATVRTLERLAQCGLVFSVQPLHLLGDLPNIARLQPWLLAHTHAYRAMLRVATQFGTMLAIGTDFPVVPANPIVTLHAAVNRTFPDGTPLAPQVVNALDRLSVAEAVTGYTIGAAFAAGEEQRKGTLAPGKVGDWVTLSQDIFRCQPEKIIATEVVATFVGSKCVFGYKF